ncbi:hypothetical protein CHLRE_02g143227v5 [Chlamydomonas reinhardtii]|uniref:Uncharacterized protein n=1 Tax=Chlamydomonas reinhardtii TaxID=3055 RepID=A0A2K3E4J5_CHLRE|nr:uncharacterized protein CHLRE_02g143227v5 [Chlamydomonas reinhardtii]XP_042927960.1 uncharacterized protein CHLRE_02g143227v5 [Chlamydomonas reinhardtii]XP_042927961.1 uncharacterized protein CHLRE_02g143227v5 [Chlamydomonas reinhardtii]PNW87709.1 hypothetical protein CHLRE_02g143227v5 [Chlamydomonas reinhardtii]PNW87710.1 hypothetical protein CHLRE_02g143227v5 [Chlamydomonas reinhardtii]PNW87711.1 hypothetical protein CHLRE_02g143227v5 [Chlamydomonas reinhardtii]
MISLPRVAPVSVQQGSHRLLEGLGPVVAGPVEAFPERLKACVGDESTSMKRGPHVGHVLSRVARAQDGRQILAIIIQVVGAAASTSIGSSAAAAAGCPWWRRLSSPFVRRIAVLIAALSPEFLELPGANQMAARIAVDQVAEFELEFREREHVFDREGCCRTRCSCGVQSLDN